MPCFLKVQQGWSHAGVERDVGLLAYLCNTDKARRGPWQVLFSFLIHLAGLGNHRQRRPVFSKCPVLVLEDEPCGQNPSWIKVG
jgi:hypothetical protein